jgi:hypothetical protein
VKVSLMRLSTIRTGIVAAAAAIAFAACGSHGMVPSQTAPGGGFNAVPAPAATPKPSPCKITGLWYFRGSCVYNQITSKGLTVKLAAYKGITFTAKLGPNDAKGKVGFVLGDATNKKDITGTSGGKSFPFHNKVCVNGQGSAVPCEGKTFVYFEAVNTGSVLVTLKATPAIQITDANGFPAKNECFPSILTTHGWQDFTPLGNAPKGNSLSLAPAPQPFYLPPGPLYIALACK